MKRTILILGLCLLSINLRAATTTAPLQLDLTAKTAPISPYIYGQFIEHLGRCIYGGIWAEMLEDRKFYFPITAEYAPYKQLTDTAYPVVGASPWQIVGSAGGVSMQKNDVFVGTHTPAIANGFGIRQLDLGVVAGKNYAGYFWAKAANGAEAAVEVALVTGSAPTDRHVATFKVKAGDYTKHTFSFTASQSTDKASLELNVRGAGILLGTISLMPADNVNGMRRDTLELLKQLNSPIYRWPGGNFTSGYDWRDGIGDRDRRPPRGNPAWTGVEHNDFGTDEFITFCREVNTEPMIAANTGFGDAYSAAQWVEYCNGSTKSLAGGWRAKNGHANPFSVKYWCVGNEMFGPWQLGFMQLSQYAIKHNLVATAMKAVDPSLKLSAVGAIDTINKDNDPEQVKRGVTWSEGMLLDCAENMDLISEHFYEGRVPWAKGEVKRDSLESHVGALKKTIRHIAERHRELQAKLPNLHGRTIPIAMDEWNFWHREYVYGELGCQYDLADALGVAAGLHEYFRQSDIIKMAHYAQTVNVIGAIKTSRTAAEMESTGLVLQLYRAHFGQTPLKISGDFGGFDVSAALSADGKTVTIAVVNPSAQPVSIPVSIVNRDVKTKGTRWTVGGASELSHNAPGQQRQVDLTETRDVDLSQPLTVPALSCALFSIPL
ncbi:MAG: alpha-L-arabinofuranosidase C-terminal domain-containing protein [Nibricoccus sp.]